MPKLVDSHVYLVFFSKKGSHKSVRDCRASSTPPKANKLIKFYAHRVELWPAHRHRSVVQQDRKIARSLASSQPTAKETKRLCGTTVKQRGYGQNGLTFSSIFHRKMEEGVVSRSQSSTSTSRCGLLPRKLRTVQRLDVGRWLDLSKG